MKQTITFLRIEGAAILFGSVVAYDATNYSWLLFVLLLLAVDVSMLGYLVNQKIGALVYNVGHSLILPLLLLAVWILGGNDTGLALSLIWIAHIGMDRMFGYGLKETSGFKHTHLGKL